MDHRDTQQAVGVTRRSVLKTGTVLAAGSMLAGSFFFTEGADAAEFGKPLTPETDASVDVKYSVCLACHSACGIRCRIENGVLVKVDGNPYHPNTLEPHLPYATDPAVARLTPGRLCAKGQSAPQVLYNPYRIKEPLKRVGARGSGQWETIPWSQAFSEIAAAIGPLRDLSTPIDPSKPELGPKVNQVLFTGGRNEHGQKEFTDRFWGNGFGTTNKRHDHTSICETSHHVAYELAQGNGAYGVKAKDKASTDLANAEFVLWFGSDPLAANFPFTAQARKLIDMLKRGGKLAVVDPRLNVAAAKADWWLPVKPTTDAALALAIARDVIDGTRYNVDFLQRPHDGAANPTNELNSTDATWLVKLVGGVPTGYLRADEAGISGGTSADFVVWNGAAGVQYDSVDAAQLLPGQVTVNGIVCKTAFEIYADSARSKTLAEWSAICGIDVPTIQAVAAELTAHGRRVSVEHYRGPVKNTAGVYHGLSIVHLNTLIGNFNWKGGHTFGGGHWHETGGKANQRFSPKTVVNGVSPSGIQFTRVQAKYEDSAEFASNGYPAQRPWFPFANHFNYQEVIPSIDEGYPYPIKALFLYWNDIAYSAPAMRAVTERVLADTAKVPLVVAIDIEMGETSVWADYILPDTTYLERWSTPHVGSTIQTQTSGVRQPVVGAFDGQMNYTPYLPKTKMLEDILIGLGNALGLPMQLEDESANPIPLQNAWSFFSQMINNIADEDGGPGIDYVLARGGRFEDYSAIYDGERMAHRFSGRIHLYSEPLGTAFDSMTGQPFEGYPTYKPPADLLDQPLSDGGYPLTLITYKQAWHSMARTICNPWLVSIEEENFIELNASDAASRGIATGDLVRITSAALPAGVTGRAKVTQTLRPGIVAIAHSFGHWEMSSKASTVDGVASSFDPTRANGIAVNPLMRTDPVKPNVSLQDKVGGSISYSNTGVQVAKV